MKKAKDKKQQENEEFKYKPKLDPVSVKLMEKKRKNNSDKNEGKKIWEHLHNLDKEITEKRDQKFLEMKQLEEAKSLEGCTFHPQLCANYSGENSPPTKTDYTFYDRNRLWKQHLANKLFSQKEYCI